MFLRSCLRPIFAVVCLSSPMLAVAQSAPVPAPVPRSGVTAPLLSLSNLDFLIGTWTAVSRDGRTVLGSYTFAPQLDGHVLTRTSTIGANCDRTALPACPQQDLFYVYQDVPGAPLKAISMDSAGHVLHYIVDQNAEGSTSTLGRQDFVFFSTDPGMLGPRLRLRYERNVDTQTGKEAMSGAFEMLQTDGSWRPLQQWYGTRQ